MGEQNRIRQSETESLYHQCMLGIQFFHVQFKHKYFMLYTLGLRVRKNYQIIEILRRVHVIQ